MEEIYEEKVLAYSKIDVSCWYLLGRIEEKRPKSINFIRLEEGRNAATFEPGTFPIFRAILCLSIQQPPLSTRAAAC